MQEPSAEQSGAGKWGWLKGFSTLWVAPRRVLPLLGSQAGKVFVAALLLMTAASVVSNWFYAVAPGLREQFGRIVMQRVEQYIAKHPELTAEQQQELRQRVQQGMGFSLTRSLVGGLISNAIVLLSLLGLLWLLQPLVAVSWKQLGFAVLVTALGYVSSIGAAGEVFSAALQALGQSLRVQPSLGALVVPEEQPLLFSVLTRVHLGALLQFGVLGFLLAQRAEIALWRGMLWGYGAWGIWLGLTYGLGALMA